MPAAVKFQVKVKDFGYEEFLTKAHEIAEGPAVVVGVLSDAEAIEDGLTMADIATFHEFGTVNIPQRSFVRSTVDANFQKIQDYQMDQAAEVLLGDLTLDRALGKIGLQVATMMQERIKNVIPPPLKSRQGTPLWNTGRLIRSITWQVIL